MLLFSFPQPLLPDLSVVSSLPPLPKWMASLVMKAGDGFVSCCPAPVRGIG